MPNRHDECGQERQGGAHRKREGRVCTPASSVRARSPCWTFPARHARGHRGRRAPSAAGPPARRGRAPGLARHRWRPAPALRIGWARSRRSRPRLAARSASACELTYTHLLAAIDMAPATSPATPATRSSGRPSGRRHAYEHRLAAADNAVVGAERRRRGRAYGFVRRRSRWRGRAISHRPSAVLQAMTRVANGWRHVRTFNASASNRTPEPTVYVLIYPPLGSRRGLAASRPRRRVARACGDA